MARLFIGILVFLVAVSVTEALITYNWQQPVHLDQFFKHQPGYQSRMDKKTAELLDAIDEPEYSSEHVSSKTAHELLQKNADPRQFYGNYFPWTMI
ncbi:unnamed protein product [Bursaphelenchus okinawaensis]|uniref:Uncharacterized protein n=1 Tax=Bursaphelenchus okinawaensis TaxID=465554 RepID=A0A811KDU1_9BILA|nr:unnamed protein product [Bursaphelenchus okinawaensis]CAG9101289.1 unnamed protein product [Bursaphelenchus okinawaensis]